MEEYLATTSFFVVSSLWIIIVLLYNNASNIFTCMWLVQMHHMTEYAPLKTEEYWGISITQIVDQMNANPAF